MGERLVVEWICYIGGIKYTNRDHDDVQLPMQMEIEHRDNEASRLTLTVFDGRSDEPFPNYNGTPDPYLNPEIQVQAFARWEDEALVKMFSGLLVAKKATYPRSGAVFVALHKAFKLRKRGKVDTLESVSIQEMLRMKAAEEGCDLSIHSSAAGNPFLTEPAETIIQPGSSRWRMMDHHLREGGYITNTIRENQIVVRVNKSDGEIIQLARGDDRLVSFDLRSEQKREGTTARRKGHAHDHKPGRFQHNEDGVDPSKGRNVTPVPSALPKRRKGHSRSFFARESVKGIARQLERLGREITLTFRLEPTMRNEERIALSGFGPQISGTYETKSVVHRMGNTLAQTQVAGIKK